MFHQPEDDFVSSARYYATPQEQKILIQGLQRYFSLPERSQNRNKIAKEVSMILRVYSPHWTHRAVRLWFNNNKHTYLPTIPGVGNVVNGGNMIDNGNANNNMNMSNIPMKNPMNNNYFMNMNPNCMNGIGMNPQMQMQMPQIPMAPFPQQMPQDASNLYFQGNMMNNQMMQMPQYPQMGIPMIPPMGQQQMQIPMTDQQMPPAAANPMNGSKNSPQKAKTIKLSKPDQSSKVVLPPISMTSTSSAASTSTTTPAQPPSSSPSLSQQDQQNQNSLRTPIPTSPLIDSPDTVPIAKGPKETKCVTNPPMKFSNAPPSNLQSPSQIGQSLSSSQASNQMQQSVQDEGAENQEYGEVSSIINEIREIDSIFNSNSSLVDYDQLNNQFLQLVESYDDSVFQLITRIGTLNPELVEPAARFVRIAFPIEPSTSIYNFLSSSSNMRLDSTSFSNMIGNDMSISYLMFPDSMSNFDLTNPMFPRMPSTSSFNQLQMANDPSFSSFKDFSSTPTRQNQTSNQSMQPQSSSTNPATTNDGNSIVNSNSGSESESEKEDQVKRTARSTDQFAQPNIFQTRQYIDEKLSYFEAHALNDEYAAYTSSALGDTQRMLYVIKYKEKFRNRSSTSGNENSNDSNENESRPNPSSDFTNHSLNLGFNNGNDFSNAYAVESRYVINSLTVDHDNAWMLSKGNLIKVPITQSGIPQTTISLSENKFVNDLGSLNLNFSNGPNLNSGSSSVGGMGGVNFYEDGIITTYQSSFGSNINSGAVVCYPHSNNLFFVNGNSTPFSMSSASMADLVTKLPTKYTGFYDIVNIPGTDRLLCSTAKSATIRLISPNAAAYGEIEERCFVGHCGQVLGIHPLSPNLFASRCDDQTVRIWDIRERGSGQVLTITTPHVSPISLAGNENYVICGFHNKYICVVDLRFGNGVPILGLPTQEYGAIAMNYCEEDDSLTMIGVIDKDSVKDSMVFAEMSHQSRLSILRCYSNFIGPSEDE